MWDWKRHPGSFWKVDDYNPTLADYMGLHTSDSHNISSITLYLLEGSHLIHPCLIFVAFTAVPIFALDTYKIIYTSVILFFYYYSLQVSFQLPMQFFLLLKSR